MSDTDRNARIELVAAALADAEFYPGAWEDTGPLQRAAYRDHSMDLLVKHDSWAALQIVDLAGVLATENGLAELRGHRGRRRPAGVSPSLTWPVS